MVHTEAQFAEQIMVDLVTQGYRGNDLHEHFRKEVSQIRSAVESMLAETKKLLAALEEGEESARKKDWITADEVEVELEHD